MIPNNVLNLMGNLFPNTQAFKNLNTPNDVAQYLLNTGKVNQNQVNQAMQMWNNPQIRQMIGNKYQ